MVRQAMRAGLGAEVDRGVERFFRLYAGNVHRHGTPAFPKAYFEMLVEVFGRDCEVLIVSHRSEPVAAVFSFYFRGEVIAYSSGDTTAARTVAANDFKYWEVMRRACERGCTLFDYGRSKRGTGSFDFKRNWGFEPTPLHYEYKLVRGTKVPQHNPLNPRYRLLSAAWRRLPLPLANWL